MPISTKYSVHTNLYCNIYKKVFMLHLTVKIDTYNIGYECLNFYFIINIIYNK